ncbi:unnamed protein product [Dibothriocephalus latus]|uniref:KY-like immunoglobulin-like domain-containing protein n=1 Tax=Dibothriocephalus latus TaxID=60516 RepID=A0A3P6U1W7_DIBLA|nr:unnamed protein product [Dibothriocephalus latus]
MNFENIKTDSPEQILMDIREEKTTYADVFLTLFKNGVDKGKIFYRLKMNYFLPDPGQLIYTHFPHDTEWQLLHEPITLKEFQSFPFVRISFFKYNLSMHSHCKAVVESTDPEIRILLGFPSGSEKSLSFSTQLTFDDQDSTENYNSIPLKRYVRHEVLKKKSRLAIYVRPPKPGAYILSISVKRTQNEVAIATEASGSVDNRYEDVCEYGLMAKISPKACLPPFPHEDSGGYGQMEHAKRFNIRAVCRDATVRATQGTVELRFTNKDPSQPLPRLMGELKSTAFSEEAMKHCIVQRPLSNNKEFAFSIFLPDAGEYNLKVYANDPKRDGGTFFLVSALFFEGWKR